MWFLILAISLVSCSIVLLIQILDVKKNSEELTTPKQSCPPIPGYERDHPEEDCWLQTFT
jgi:hypothetical protein